MSHRPTVALVGAHGHGRSHTARLEQFEAQGVLTFAAVVDPNRPRTERPWFAGVDDLLAAGAAPDVAILCTPIHTHAPLATALMTAGVDVLLEKPPTATAAGFRALLDTERATGRRCQVAFQSLGSHAIERVRDLVADGAVGAVTHLGGAGTWLRDTRYWQRSPWAGRRVLDGVPVVDGVVTNPLAHATATALRLAGACRAEDVRAVRVELHRANAIEADDTSSVVVTTTTGPRIALGLTLCAEWPGQPVVSVFGERGRIDFHYTLDTVRIEIDGRPPVTEKHGRTDLLLDLLDARAHSGPLRSPLVDTGAFTAVLEAVRTAPDPAPIPDRYVRWVDDESGRHPVVDGVDRWIDQVAVRGHGFAAVGAPWAREPAR
ncbi:Gfo/Idh/MocA family protein [Parafrankia elaeagni]|uniref:Gfo/Idh/MocA family protein n=1 Tax=Parafrankia elaeagni TaxID=222534 RepID=UPI0003808EC4|nr:Gfo/Idh/MocA family oxidoreductase [Parafrankia elaeagni]